MVGVEVSSTSASIATGTTRTPPDNQLVDRGAQYGVRGVRGTTKRR
jgi:hypothetical protein